MTLSGSVEHMQGQIEGDISMSGMYTIVNITDKFLSGKMIQKFDLQRANFQENK